MPTGDDQLLFLQGIQVHAFLRLADGRRGLEGGGEQQRHSGGHAAQQAAGVIGGRSDLAAFQDVGIVVPAAPQRGGLKAAAEIGYPVLVRPSFVLGGRAMQIVGNEEQLKHYLKTAVEIDEEKPVLVDKYISGKEVEVDAVCDGRNVFVPGIMELVERTGIHSGDSISVYPAFSISDKVKGIILQYTKKLGLGIGIVGIYNIQFIVDADEISPPK